MSFVVFCALSPYSIACDWQNFRENYLFLTYLLETSSLPYKTIAWNLYTTLKTYSMYLMNAAAFFHSLIQGQPSLEEGYSFWFIEKWIEYLWYIRTNFVKTFTQSFKYLCVFLIQNFCCLKYYICLLPPLMTSPKPLPPGGRGLMNVSPTKPFPSSRM